MILRTDGLLSKWGFGDGDTLFDFLLDHGIGTDDHAVLCAVVEEHVVPALDQQVETFRVVTIHNPIRARSIDGVPWEGHYETTPEGVLTPATVEVDNDVILQAAQRVSASV